ncbi:hypothetical protein ACHAW6_004736 [Cyclotella cf. meneghiniana]
MYVKLPPGIRTKQEKPKGYVLKLLTNLYESVILYFGNKDNILMLIIRQLNKSGPNIEDQDHPTDYIRVNIKKTHDGMCKLHNVL